MIEVTRVTYAYPGSTTPALRNLSLAVGPGEFVAVLGRNGSGKSTLARLLNGILVPAQGTVKVLGMDTRDRTQGPRIRQAVGLLFSNPDNQLVSTVVEEDVAFGPENLGLPPAEIRARVDWALQAVDMQSYAQHPLHALSGGQKQRVAIAGLLALKPRAMVLDEPTSMLDPRGRREVLETLLQLHRREGITVVLVTHHVEEAVHAHRVVLLEQGQVCREGPAREVLADSLGLQALGVEPLPVPLLIQALAARGIALPGGVLQASELVEWLCR